MVTRRRAILILRRTVDVLIVGLVALVLLALFLGRIVPLTGRETLIIAGSSMEPTLPIGSAVVIEPVPVDALAVGDIVTLKVGSKPSIFTHRIVRSLTLDGVPYIETKGDANAAPDGATTPAAAVAGRVAWSIPFAGYLVALLSVPIGVLFVLVLGATLVLAAWLLDTGEVVVPRPGPEPAGEDGPSVDGRVPRYLAARGPLDAKARRAARPGRTG